MNKKIVLALLLVGAVLTISGCVEREYRTFQLEDETIIECLNWQLNSAYGAYFTYCKDGVEYYNQQNVRYLP